MDVNITITDGKVDLDDLLQQIPIETLLSKARSNDMRTVAFSLDEMQDLSENNFRVLMCKVFGISEMSDDNSIMKNFREKCKIQKEVVTLSVQ